MALNTSGPVGIAEVEEVCELHNDVYRNQWITFVYWQISQRLRRLIGTNASWCTFSTWSSRTIGSNLRLDSSSRRVQELTEDPHTSISPRDNQFLLKLQYRVSTRDDGAAQHVLALGNRLVFHEIGYAAAHFLDWAETNPASGADDWEEYRKTIEPYEASDLFPAADVEQLRSGLECYHRARHARSDDEKAELVLRGNVLLAAYEQWRVDPMLKVALDPFPRRFLRVVRANPHAPVELSLTGTGTPWALRHHSPILRALAAQFGGAMTRWVMALDVPLFSAQIRPLSVGRTIPPPAPGASLYPSSLETVSDPELKTLLGVYDHSERAPEGCGARNWTRFPDRMNFIVNLFRAGQQDENLYQNLPEVELRLLDLDISDAKLDELRRRGDDEIDQWIEHHLTENRLDPRRFVQDLIAGKVDRAALDPSTPGLPAWADDTQLAAGQKFFRTYRAEVGSALFSASLPKSYTAARGARVLITTAELVSDAGRRIAETGQMLLAAMAADDFSEPPLRPHTDAYKAARGVRLFHGAVRQMILTHPEAHWQREELGVPVNQEDLLGTLAVFTVVVIESLDKMGVTCTVQDRDAYFHLWLVIGHLLGIDYDRLYRDPPPKEREPLTYADMQLLARMIFERNAEVSPGGQELMAALLNVSQGSMPFFLKGLPGALTRRLIGDESADILGIPPPGPTRMAIAVLRPLNAIISPYVHSNALGGLANTLTRRLYRTWIDARGGSTPPWLDRAPIRAARRVRDVFVERTLDIPGQMWRSVSAIVGGN